MSLQQIPEDFFRGEEIDGFYVEPMMKRIWAAELKVLAEVDRICRKYNLTYFADYGTLLGAIRHQGFIPWDDDIDISMRRKDYMTFLSVAQKELAKDYSLHSYFTREDHDQPFAVVMNRDDIGVNTQTTEEFYGCPFIIGVEIYPLDNLTRNLEERQTQILLHQAVYDCGQRFYQYQESGELAERIQKIQDATGVTFRDDQSLVMQVRQLADKIAMIYTDEESDELVPMYDFSLFEEPHIRKKEWFSDQIRLPFEYTTIPVPVGYEEFLRSKYGDYMTPVRNGGGHDYPFYKVQLPALPEALRASLIEKREILISTSPEPPEKS
jgi:lipopolysaccharide cholinephosphotransferase